MEKISDEISRKVISLSSGNVIGYVLDVLFTQDIKRIDGYLVVDEESEELSFLAYDKVKSKSEECFVVQDESDLEIYISSFFNNPIGKQVYDENGVNLGKVVDVYFEKDIVKKVITGKCEFPIQCLQKAGNDCLIYGKKKRKKEKKVLFEIEQPAPKVYIQEKEKICPSKVIMERGTLIGKTITHEILGQNHELIARENDIVTKSIVKKAKLHNRYNLLMFYVK